MSDEPTDETMRLLTEQGAYNYRLYADLVDRIDATVRYYEAQARMNPRSHTRNTEISAAIRRALRGEA